MPRLRVVPHFSSGIVERAKREHAWKSPHARKGVSRALTFRSLYYPWAGATRSLFYAILAIAIVLLGSIKPILQEQDFLVKDNFTRFCWQAENHLYPE